MASTGKNSEKQVKLQEKFQAILSAMLREEDNKYCVDCDAKGPRWASWNLGVFLCIRCAGIHRNLGVHISKVKSVNLDQWTAEQIASMQAMGNSKARAVYEANLSDNFRRSQNDSAMEQFIRGKYEARKWIAKEWIPPSITELINDLAEDEPGKEKTKTAAKPKVDIKVKPSPSSNGIKLGVGSTKTSANSTSSKTEAKVTVPKNEPTAKESPLFDFESSPVETVSKPAESNVNYFDSDLFPAFTSSNDTILTTTAPVSSSNSNEKEQTLENVFLGDQNIVKNDGKIDKQSILALYKNSNSNSNISGAAATTNNNNNIFNNANLLGQNNNPNLLLQQQQFNVFNSNNNNSNPLMPQGFSKPAQPQHFTNSTNSFPGNFASTPQSNPMNLLNFDMHQLNINQSKPNPNSSSINPYLANMKPVNFNGTIGVQSNQLNFNAFPNTNTSILPNIGNTFSTDLWQ